MSSDDHAGAFAPVKELRWLFFDLNSYFASVEQQENPALRGKPVAVVPMQTDSTCAIAASYEAKAYGVKTGTKIYEARQLCPQLVCVLARHDMYVAYHHWIMAELENHIPVTKICSVDEAACRLFNNERSVDQARQLAQRIKQGLRDNIGEAIRCSIGVAPNIYLAKIGTELQKPDGLVILEPGHYQEQLFTLELRDLTGINTRMERRLIRAGVRTTEQFWNLSPKHARSVWGSVEGERLWYKLHGYEVPELATERRMVGHSRVLDPNLRQPALAYGIARQLTQKAAARLRRYQLYGRRFSLSVRSVLRTGWAREALLTPTQDSFLFIEALHELWRLMLQELHHPAIKKVSVAIYDLCEPDNLTADLFAENNPCLQKHDKLSRVMDNINKRYGAGTIQIGACSKTQAGYVGTKIAFTRVPELAEFGE